MSEYARRRPSLQRGEMALFLSMETRRLFGDITYEGIDLGLEGADEAQALTLVAVDLQKVLLEKAISKVHTRGRRVPEGAEEYMKTYSTIIPYGIQDQLDEGMKTGIAFQNNLALAVLHASERGLGLEQGIVEYPSQVLHSDWFTPMLKRASVTANGFWGAHSSSIVRSPEECYNYFLSKTYTGTMVHRAPFTQVEGGIDYSPELDAALSRNYAAQKRGARKTSGCPARHREFRVGEGQRISSPEGLSVIELYADALRRAYDYTLMINGIPNHK